MAKKLYVGNLSHDITDSELQDLFEQFGSVVSAQVIMNRETQRSKGFGFVEMSTEDEAKAAIEALNNKEAYGRPLTVNLARPKEATKSVGGYRSSGSGMGGFRGGDNNGSSTRDSRDSRDNRRSGNSGSGNSGRGRY